MNGLLSFKQVWISIETFNMLTFSADFQKTQNIFFSLKYIQTYADQPKAKEIVFAVPPAFWSLASSKKSVLHFAYLSFHKQAYVTAFPAFGCRVQ